MSKSLKNIAIFVKNATIRGVEIVKKVPLPLETIKNPLSKTRRGSLTPGAEETKKTDKKFSKELQKMQLLSKKLQKFVI